MADDTLPTGQELAARLYAQGLAPPEVWRPLSMLPIPSPLMLGGNGQAWEPWRRIDHCWYLVEQMGLSIKFHPATPLPRPNGSMRQAYWWVGEPGLNGVIVDTFAEVPQAICQAALKVQAWRKGA